MKFPIILVLALAALRCGGGRPEAELKITNPEDAPAEAADLGKYVVDLRNNGKFFCSGVLVSEHKVLTAAHCFVREKPLSELRARVDGKDHRVLSFRTLADQDGKVSEDYFPNFDLALLEIENVEKSGGAFPKLMTMDELRSAQGQKALMAGYGVSSSSKVDLGSLRFGWARVKRVAAAGRFAGTLVVDVERSGPCMGDSGGPLFIQKGDAWFIAGLVHGVNWYTNPNFFGEDPCAFDEATYVVPGQYLNPEALAEHDAFELISIKGSGSQDVRSWVELCETAPLDREDLLVMKMITLRNRFKTCQETFRNLEARPISLDFGPSRVISSRSLSLLPGLDELKADFSRLTLMDKALPNTRLMSVLVGEQSQLDHILHVRGVKSLEIRQSSDQVLDYSLLSELDSLVQLRLNGLKMTSLPSFAKLDALEHLEISLNHLDKLDFLKGADHLAYLNASSNQIRDISGLAQTLALRTLILSNNQIEDINALKDLKNLELISLVNNRIDRKVCPRPEEQEGDICAF